MLFVSSEEVGERSEPDGVEGRDHRTSRCAGPMVDRLVPEESALKPVSHRAKCRRVA